MWIFEKHLELLYLTWNTAIAASILQNDEKPTVSGVSTWDYTKQVHKDTTKVTKLAMKMVAMSLTNVD